MTSRTAIDRARLGALLETEVRIFCDRNPRSAAAFARTGHLLGGVPMTWMAKSAGPFPLYLDRPRGARVTDLDGHELIDFCLGDTGAMAGRSPEPSAAAVQRRYLELEDYLHLALINRGIFLTPFHNMALMCPATTSGDVQAHLDALRDAVAALRD